MRIGIFARPEDALARHFAAAAQARGVETLQVALHGLAAGVPAAFDGEAWLFSGEDLAELDAAFVRQVPADRLRAEGVDLEALDAQAERAAYAESCLMDLELRGKRVVNPLLATRPYDHKPLQLATFQRLGLRIPRTLITNYPRAAELFAEEIGETIMKPVGGGAPTRLLDAEARKHLAAIATRPLIFQERILGPDIRVTVVAGRVASAVEIPTESVDYRNSEAYRRRVQQYAPHALSPTGRDLALAAARACGQVLSGVDLKAIGGGEYVLLEANSSPVYLDIEEKTGHPITEAILDYLLGPA